MSGLQRCEWALGVILCGCRHTNVIETISLLLWPAVRGRSCVLVGHVLPPPQSVTVIVSDTPAWLAEFMPLLQNGDH